MVTDTEKSQIECPNCRVNTPRPRQATTATCANCGKAVALDDRVFEQKYVFGGEVLTRGKIIVGPKGAVKANLSATEVAVEGTVEGNVKAVDRFSLGKSAVFHGNATAGALVVTEGATLIGRLEIGPSEVNSKHR